MDAMAEYETMQDKAAEGTFRRWNPPFPGTDGGIRSACTDLARMACALRESVEEALWPTRCIICDKPGALICADCLLRLPYIDRCRSCPRCGAPGGYLVCTECNSFTLGEMGRTRPPFEQCIGVIEHRGAAKAIASGYKDAGERRLGACMAQMMARAAPRAWWRDRPAVSYVPADRIALRRRGFDHMESLAHAFSAMVGMPCVRLVEKLPVKDQRGLSRFERFQNMAHGIRPARQAPSAPRSVVLLDDVHTTGATLYAACDVLAQMGARRIRCLTFARVP